MALREGLLFALLLSTAGCGSSSDTSSDGGSDGRARDASGPDGTSRDGGEASVEAGEAGADVADAMTARANGTLGTWTTQPPMPVPRANHCAVYASGYLVVIGGNYSTEGGFVNTDAVDVAEVHADGSLGPWSLAGKTPSPVNSCTATAKGGVIYLVDGIYDDMTKEGHLFSAELPLAGKLSSWTDLGSLPSGQDAFYSSAWVADDAVQTLYAMDARLPMSGDNLVALRVATSPKLGTWHLDPFVPGFFGHPEYAFTGSFVYALGGYTSTEAGNPVLAGVHGAPIQADGSLGAPFDTTALPSPLDFGAAIAVDSWLYVVGGKNGVFTGSGEAAALSAQVGSDGTLGEWKTLPALPEGRTSLALTLAKDFLYVTGGGYMAGGLATVYAARVRF